MASSLEQFKSRIWIKFSFLWGWKIISIPSEPSISNEWHRIMLMMRLKILTKIQNLLRYREPDWEWEKESGSLWCWHKDGREKVSWRTLNFIDFHEFSMRSIYLFSFCLCAYSSFLLHLHLHRCHAMPCHWRLILLFVEKIQPCQIK